MKTIDIHTHLLNKDVRFDRTYDKLLLPFFAKKFGFDQKKLIENPYKEYVDSLTRSIRESEHIEKIVLFGVDSRMDDHNNVLHNDITVCASNEDVYKVYKNNKDIIIRSKKPTQNPLRVLRMTQSRIDVNLLIQRSKLNYH